MSAKKPAAGSNKPEFFAIKDEAMIAKILDVACRHKILLTVWLRNQTVRFETRIIHFFQHLKRFAIQFPPDLSVEQFAQALKEQGSEDILGSFQIDTVNFFIKTTVFSKPDKASISLLIPPEIFKLQRRANLRIPFPRKLAPKLTMLDPSKTIDTTKGITEKDLLAYRILDVSAGGVAIAAPIADKGKFPDGQLLHDLRFKLRASDVIAEGHVKHAAEVLSDLRKPVLKVGIAFDGLKAQYEKLIVQFVLDESRKLFSLLH